MKVKDKIRFDLNNLDRNARPQDDFYRFGNGGWIDNNPIPSDKAIWGVSGELVEQNLTRLHDILNEAEKNKDASMGSNEQKLRDFWIEFMDMDKRNLLGTQPIKAELQGIYEVTDIEGIQEQIIHLEHLGVGTFWNIVVMPDSKQPTRNILCFGQGGMGLPTPDYYSTVQFKEIRQKYVKYIQELFQLLGYAKSRARSTAFSVIRIETRLASHAMLPQEARDRDKTYNKLNKGQLEELIPIINWTHYFRALNISNEKEFIVQQPEFFRNLNTVLSTTNIEELKEYLLIRLISALAMNLSDDFINIRFNFYGKVLSGTEEIQPSWKRGVESVVSKLNHIISPIYVSRHFEESAKEATKYMVANIKRAFGRRIRKLSWMSESTKQEALEKLKHVDVMVGYPDKWRNMEGLSIGRRSHLDNLLNIEKFEEVYQLDKLGKPADNREWFMPAPTVNAYAAFEFNHIVFPAGILQSPFFDPEADDSFNYGAIGGVIGHEMTHFFDDQGRKYDATGSFNAWGKEEDTEKFLLLAKLIIEQFAEYTILDDLHIKGELTQGENIGDLGGLCIALDAYMDTLSESEKDETIYGFTPVQRFFLGWAQVWRGNIREEEARRRIEADPHSPGVWRTNGPIVNMDEFHEAFGTKPGDKLYRGPEERITIW